MRDNSAQFTGSIPHHYDRAMGPVFFEPYAALMAERVAAFAPARLLETAAGSGIVTRRMRDALPSGTEIVATDLNAPMLDVAKAKFRADENVSFTPADAQALPFADAAFDAMVCQFGVMFYPDKAKAHREARRVLAKGGRYWFSVWNPPPGTPWLDVANAAVARTFTSDPPTFYQVPFSYAAIDPAVAALKSAGFSRIRCDILPVVAPIADFAAFSRGLVFGNPFGDQVRARGVDPESFAASLEKDVRAAFGGAGAMPLEATFFQAE